MHKSYGRSTDNSSLSGVRVDIFVISIDRYQWLFESMTIVGVSHYLI